MIFTTTDTIPGKKYDIIGIVKGSTVQTVHIGKDIAASFRTIVGGEAKGYNEMMEKARDIAMSRMEEEAKRLNADAVICIRFSTSSIMQSAAEIMACGTAIKFIG